MIHWHVLGAGAIGGLFAARLTHLGHTVTLLSRASGRSLRTLTYVADGAEEALEFVVQGPDTQEPIDHLLVATKSYDVEPAIESIAHRLRKGTDLVLLCNGMGYHQRVANRYPNQRIIAGTTTAGCSSPTPDRRILAGTGETRMGSINGERQKPAWFESLERASWHCQWVEDISPLLLKKLAINAVINPLTALWDIPNGALMGGAMEVTFQRALNEVCTRLEWAGFHALASELPAAVTRVIQDTAANTSSMRSDWRKHGKTEVDAILGYLLEEMGSTTEAPSQTTAQTTPLAGSALAGSETLSAPKSQLPTEEPMETAAAQPAPSRSAAKSFQAPPPETPLLTEALNALRNGATNPAMRRARPQPQC